MTTVTFTSSGTWTAPAGVTSVDAQCWGEGGDGSIAASGSHSGGGGGGGEYAEETTLAVTPGNVYTFTIGAGGSSTATSFPGDSVTVTAHAGSNSSASQSGAVGGSGSANSIHFSGGHGGNGAAGATKGGGGGGSGAGTGSAGATGSNAVGSSGASGGTAPSGGGNGGNGGTSATSGVNGSAPGGGGGGGGDGASHVGGNGAAGQITLTYSAPAAGTATLTGVGTLTAAGGLAGAATLTGAGTLSAVQAGSGHATLTGIGTLAPAVTQRAVATLTGVGTLTAAGGAPAPAAVNQWAATFTQPSGFTTTPPALQSLVVALTPAGSVGGGSGVPSAGNWLFCLTGWNQNGLPASTVGDADDIHSFWRPGNETASTWAVSTPAGKTRCSAWYTPNLARSPGDVYVAPSGAQAGQACLVVEISGLGPWDVVTGISTNYSAAATTLGLALGVPPQSAFTIACVCGDRSDVTQAFAPATWTTLSTVTATNGVDTTCDAVLTSAFKPSTAGSVSVSGTASAASDLSGVMLQVETAAASPVPGGANPAWPGRMILEAAFGAGMETPADQMTWTSLSDSAWTSIGQGYKRFWGWQDTSGVPYALGQLQSGTGSVQLDNADGLVSPSNSSSPFYPHCQPGTPVRLRMALGTLTDGTVVNRWYTWQRDALAWPEKRNKALRGYVPLTLTDVWSVVSAAGPSAYRGEVGQDNPSDWWPMDDQPLAGGVQPVSLLNAAQGGTARMNVIAAPGGVTAGHAYTTNGQDATSGSNGAVVPPSIATYAVAQMPGWMYGDPQSSQQSSQTGNPVTANPGSAAWQQAGLAGNTGANGWFLAANNPAFPVLAAGVTVEGWFNAAFAGSATGWQNTGGSPGYYDIAGQPVSAITLATLSTNSAPVAILQLSTSGHLSLITYNGSTPTSHSVYTASDLRSNSWHSVTLTATTSAWAVYVDGGLTALVSGSGAGMTSAWTWLTLNGDYGSAGGTSPASLTRGGNVAYSHWEVYGTVLPAWRVLAHYCAAATGFGLLPAPQQIALSAVINQNGTGYTPDGTLFQGFYGPNQNSAFSFSGLAVAQAGAATSGPSARAVLAGVGQGVASPFGNAVWMSFTGLAPSFTVYTSPAADAETSAAVISGSGDSFSSGFGSGASGHGACQVSGGGGVAPPASASSLGDTVAQRLERVLGYGQVTRPNRAVDSSASLLVQAALDIGGQQAGANLQNIADSDNGLLYVDNNGTLCYRSRAHLAADTAVWQIGMNTLAGMIPFDDSVEWSSDPQRIWDAITVTPYSPDGASLASLTPSDAAAANAAQAQSGVRPKAVTSYLQDQARMQAQADWYLANFATLQRRASVVAIDAASHPAGWLMVAGMNPGDIAQIYDAPLGQPATTGNYRVSQISRSVSYGANGTNTEGRLVLVLDPLPATYWS